MLITSVVIVISTHEEGDFSQWVVFSRDWRCRDVSNRTEMTLVTKLLYNVQVMAMDDRMVLMYITAVRL